MTDAFRGAACFFRGLSLLGKPRIRRYAAAPAVLSGLLFAGLIWFFASQFADVVAALLVRAPAWLAWLEWLAWALFALLVAGLVFFSFVLVAGLVGAPFHGFLAEAVERHIAGTAPPSRPWHRTVVRIPATLFDELKKILYSLLLAVPFLLLFAVPLVNLAAPVLWFLFCAWITAFSYTDYAMSNHGFVLADIRRTLRRRRLLALGFGSAAFLALLVPFVNLLAVPAAVAGGTVLWIEELRGLEEPPP